ncbi:hypothetical protein [Pontibacter sp. SGAir0037]|uniref:hypothetical protein n=1 Tax=Pontibacter sp. SGAir0037 TaxID=2571030 RepID=UPI001F113A5B|nr:hypothetical protein [Pontibacter sp. SGAir0037]
MISCDGNPASENREITVDPHSDEDTVSVMKTGKTAQDRLEELRAWMNEKTDRADTAIRADWPEVREKLRERNAQIEQGFDSLTTESKEEYKRLKDRYSQWEERQERRQQTPLDPQKVNQWEEQLLREYAAPGSITTQNVREAYLTFIGAVRTKRQNWSDSDWDYVDHVYSQLNQRRRQLEGNISSGDKLKIRSLQAEYLTLEGTADARSLMRDMRN